MFLEPLTAPPSWYFREKGVGDTSAAPQELKRETASLGEYAVTKTDYTVTGGRATRITLSGERIAAAIDLITLDDARAVYTSFALPAKERLNCNVVSRDRLVLREGTGAKFFRIGSQIDGKPTEGAGLLLPDGIGEGKMRFSFYSGLYGYGKRHTAAYAACEDTLENIIYWHIEGTDTTVISDASHTPLLSITLTEGSVTLATATETKTF